nr:hypothetical protein [Tanacetum cinerariifolium]
MEKKANAAATCYKSDIEEIVCVVLHPIKLPPPPVLNLKMFVNERKQGTTQDASKVIDAAPQSSAISLAKPLNEKIVVATNRKNKATLNNTEKFEDHPSVLEDSRTSQMV